MASPMSWIRKYQKGMLVVFGVALMVVFLVPQLADMGQGRGKVENPVVVTWAGGTLKRQDLDRLRTRHFQTVRFLAYLLDYARDKAGTGANVNPLIEPITPILAQGEDDTEAADQRIFDRYLLAMEAEKMGVIIGDGMIDEYIAYSAGDVTVTNSELQVICRKATDGQASLGQVRDHLRLELAHRQMQIMIQTGYQLIPNASNAAQLFARTSEEIECVVMPVSIEDQISKVTATPEESKLQKIFNEGRYRLPGGDPEEPAFKTPKRVNLQYVYAEFETALQNEINKVTDEEVQKEYDRLVAAEDFSVMELIDETETAPETNPDGTPKTPETGAADGATGEGGEAGAADAENKDGAVETGEKTGEAGAGEAGAGEAGAGEEKKTDGGGDGSTDAGGSDAGNSEAKKDGEGLTRSIRAFRDLSGAGDAVFVSTGNANSLTQEQDPPVTDPPKQDPPVTDPPKQDPPVTDPPTQDPPVTEPPKQDPPVTEPPVTEPPVTPPAGTEMQEGDAAKQGETPPAVDPAKPADPAAGIQVPDTPAVQEPKRRARPLKDVANDIKRRMKIEVASEVIRQKLVLAETDIRQYQSDYMIWQASPEAERGPEPAKLDLKKLAESHGMKFGETGLKTFEEVSETQIGKLPITSIQLQQSMSVSLYVFLRFNQVQLYDPGTEMDLGNGDIYLYWPSEKEDEKVGEYKDMRDKVVEFWKKQEARNRAKADAENIVTEINGGGMRLAQKYGEKTVNTGMFSWFTNSFSGFGYGQPIGVDSPGDEFMQTAFGLEMDKAGFALNEKGDKYYVIQKSGSDRRSDEEVTGNFINQVAMFQRIPVTVYNAGESLFQKVQFDYGKQLQKKLNIEWQGK